MITKAKTLTELRDIDDHQKQLDVLLSSRRAAIEMGDQVEILRAKLRELRLEVELKQGELLASMSLSQKAKTISDLGIQPSAAAHCELAAKVPRETINALKSIQRRKGLDVTARDISPLASLPPEVKRAVGVKLMDHKTVRQALEAVKAELPKPPTGNKSREAEQSRADVRAAEFTRKTVKLRAEANTLVLMATRYAEVKSYEALIRVRESIACVKGLIADLGDPTL
jgi:hypothetical protein